MKRSIRAALGVVIVALAVPAVALATHHGGLGHHGHHHHGGAPGAASPTTGSTGTTGAPPGAGTVQSYDSQNGTLTILLAGGGTVTGTVTDRTRFDCPHSNRGRRGYAGRHNAVLLAGEGGTSGPSGASGGTGASGASGDTGASGSTGGTDTSGPTSGIGTEGSGPPHHHHHHDYPPPAPCDSSLLTGGADVLRAELDLTVNGVFFRGLELLPAVQ